MMRRLPGLSVVLAALSLALYACTSGGDDPVPSTPDAAVASPAAAAPGPTGTSTAAPAPSRTPVPTPTPLPTPEPARPPGEPAAGHGAVWSGAAQGTGAPWFSCRITPGDLDEEWTVEVGASAAIQFSCRAAQDGEGFRLSSCSGLPQGYAFSARASDSEPGAIVVEFVQPAFGGTLRFEATLTQAWVRDEEPSSTNVALAWQRDAADTLGPYTDVWAANGLAFAPHSAGAIEILDATTGTEVGVIDTRDYSPSLGLPTWVTDVKSRGSLLYAATAGKGILIFDIGEPAAPALVGRFFVSGSGDAETFSNIHNIYLSPDGSMLYAINQSHPRGDLRLIDVSDPAAPREAGRFLVPDVRSVFDGAHDVHVIRHEGREIVFLNALQSGLFILDATDPAAIETLSVVGWDGVFSHSGWAFSVGDGSLHYANADEGYDQGVTIFDVSDLENPVLLSEFKTRPGISVHNVEVVDGIAYLSYYLDGLRVVDMRDPANPREVGHFDTVAAANKRDINQGAWGVHVDEGRVYISDRETGIYAFEVEVP